MASVRRATLPPADELVRTILDTIIEDRGLVAGERVAVLVNGLGATPAMELTIVAGRALSLLAARGLRVERARSGNLLTALNMPGCSLSLLRLDDAPTTAPAWPGSGRIGASPKRVRATPAPARRSSATDTGPDAARDGRVVWAAAMAAAAAPEAAEQPLTELDSIGGDGDLGISISCGAAAIRAPPDAAWTGPATALAAMGEALRRAIGGSSGPFCATALLQAARHVGETTSAGARPPAADGAHALAAGVVAIAELGGAAAGDRTILDALEPAPRAAEAAVARGDGSAAGDEAAAAAERGASASADMMPRLGRATYLGDRVLGTPDGGATAAAIWLRAIARRG